MWMFYKAETVRGPKGPSYCLLPGITYEISRSSSDFGGFKNDISISRKHGIITVIKDEHSKVPKVRIEDRGSKFGTYVGEKAIESSSSLDPSQNPSQFQDDRLVGGVEVSQNTRIRFGLNSTIFQLEWQEIVCTGSTLTMMEKKKLSENLEKISNSKLVSSWTDDVTHVVMQETILTIKVVNALAKAVPLVTPNYFSDFLVCALSKQSVPNVENYLPKLNEKSLNRSEVSCVMRPSRSRLFDQKTFVFCDQNQVQKYAQAIEYAGGRIVVLEGEIPSKLKNDITDGYHVLIKPENMLKNKLFQSLFKLMKSNGLVSTPDTDIGVAILKDSVQLECNPRKKKRIQLSDSQDTRLIPATPNTLAPETQTTGGLSSSQLPDETFKIPQTLTSTQKSKSTSPEKDESTPRLFKAFSSVSIISATVGVNSDESSKGSSPKDHTLKESINVKETHGELEVNEGMEEQANDAVDEDGIETIEPMDDDNDLDDDDDGLFKFSDNNPVVSKKRIASSPIETNGSEGPKLKKRKRASELFPSDEQLQEPHRDQRQSDKEKEFGQSPNVPSVLKTSDGFLDKSMIKKVKVPTIERDEDNAEEQTSFVNIKVVALVRRNTAQARCSKAKGKNLGSMNVKCFKKQSFTFWDQDEVISSLSKRSQINPGISFFAQRTEVHVDPENDDIEEPGNIIEETQDMEELWNFSDLAKKKSSKRYF